MNKRYEIALCALLLWCIGTSVNAENSKIMSGYEENSSFLYCTSKPYLRCLGVDKPTCHEAIKVGSPGCISEKLLNAINGNIDDENESLSIIRSESQLYAVCLTQEFTEILLITERKLEKCAHHLEPVFEGYRAKVIREHDKLQKKLDEQP